MYPYLYSGCVYLYIQAPVAVAGLDVILQYRRASLILVNCRPLDDGGWFPPLSNTGVIKPVVLFVLGLTGLASSTLERFFVSFNFCREFAGIDYRRGAPPSAHCTPSRAQCGSSATYCPLDGACSAPQALQLCPVGCCVFCLQLSVLDWYFCFRGLFCLGRLSMSLVGCCFCPVFVPMRPVRWLAWGCLSPVFSVASGAIVLPSILAHPFGWGCQRHAPPFEIGFGWGFL